jgi:hypothetical protein
MPYRFATERQNYADYAAGKVFYALPGHPAFPIRLASEIFQSCLATRKAHNATTPCTLYDPCCGGAYHLSTLAYLHWNAIHEIIGSDIDEDVLALAQRNLALLTLDGLDRRIEEISVMWAAYGKASHVEALESATTLRQKLKSVKTHPIKTRLFRADATDNQALSANLKEATVDIVMSDIPYGRLSEWQEAASAPASPVWSMLDALRCVLTSNSVVAIASDKSQKIAHEHYRRVERFGVGKRHVTLLMLANSDS